MMSNPIPVHLQVIKGSKLRVSIREKDWIAAGLILYSSGGKWLHTYELAGSTIKQVYKFIPESVLRLYLDQVEKGRVTLEFYHGSFRMTSTPEGNVVKKTPVVHTTGILKWGVLVRGTGIKTPQIEVEFTGLEVSVSNSPRKVKEVQEGRLF